MPLAITPFKCDQLTTKEVYECAVIHNKEDDDGEIDGFTPSSIKGFRVSGGIVSYWGIANSYYYEGEFPASMIPRRLIDSVHDDDGFIF